MIMLHILVFSPVDSGRFHLGLYNYPNFIHNSHILSHSTKTLDVSVGVPVC